MEEKETHLSTLHLGSIQIDNRNVFLFDFAVLFLILMGVRHSPWTFSPGPGQFADGPPPPFSVSIGYDILIVLFQIRSNEKSKADFAEEHEQMRSSTTNLLCAACQ